jgi:biotin carboxyl carrier protein
MARFKIDLHGKESEIEVTRQGNLLHIARDEQSFDLLLRRQEGPSFVLEILLPDGMRQRIRAAGQTHGDQRQMWVNGRYFSYTRILQRGSGSGIDESLSSSIPAVVTQILVGIGDTVTEGDKLILLESMKMVIPIQAPGDGKVRAIHCTTGDSVQAGVPLIELEEKLNDK